MKYLLTIYLCAAVNGECIAPILSEYNINEYYKDHYGCVKSGLGESFELLFSGEFFDQKTINEWQLYPKFSCVPVLEENLPEVPGSGTPS
jgi:hypothetical protein